MTTLGFDEYHESFTDGLQVLRYNRTTAYIPHLDWIDDPDLRENHDYMTSKKGTNRFATILLYMSDLDQSDGGETVFAEGWPADVPVGERVGKKEALRSLRESGEVDFLERGTWQEKMVADCRSRLSVKPRMARAVLFYSQHPNGEEDHASLHGGCPVLSSVNTKWAVSVPGVCFRGWGFLLYPVTVLTLTHPILILILILILPLCLPPRSKPLIGKSMGMEWTKSLLRRCTHQSKIRPQTQLAYDLSVFKRILD